MCYVVYSLETALQQHCPSCCLPYLDTRLDCSLLRGSDSVIFSPQFLGNSRGNVTTGVAANWNPEPPDCDDSGNGYLTRSVDTGGCENGLLYTDNDVDRVLSRRSYDHLCWPYRRSDFEVTHGGPHLWIGGHMMALPCSPNDPMFFLHHCWVDKLVEMLKDRLPPTRWTYPRRARRPQRARDRAAPFDWTCEEGLDDEELEKEYTYEISPADDTCNTDAECSPVGLLWCDTSAERGECKAKCREGGVCRAGEDASCYCANGTPRCDGGRCRCQAGEATTTATSVPPASTTRPFIPLS